MYNIPVFLVFKMKKPIFISVGLRYSGAFGSNRFASFVSIMSIIGVFLGVTALIVVSSVMNGLEGEMKNRVLSLVPHLIVSQSKDPMPLNESLSGKLSSIPGVYAVSPVVDSQAVIQSNKAIQAVGIQGIDPQTFPRNLLTDNIHCSLCSRDERNNPARLLSNNPYGIILGRSLENLLRVSEGDQVRVIFPRGVRYTMAGKMPAERVFTVVGFYYLGSSSDTSTAIINLHSAQKIMRLGEKIDGYRLWLNDPFMVDQAFELLPESTTARTWREEKGELFRAISMEKKMMSLLLFLIIFVAAFNILSSLIMMVMDKTKEIAILRTMGMKHWQILGVFMVEGLYCGVVGTILGVCGGIVCANYLNEILHTLGLAGQFLSGRPLPVKIDLLFISVITACSLGLSVLATLYPSYKASKVMPAEALRYE